MFATSTFEIFRSILSAKRFTCFAKGISVRLSTGDVMELKVQEIQRSIRPVGHRFSKFSFVCTVSANETNFSYGYGEADTELLAIEKSIAEGVERAIFKTVRYNLNLQSSNGWAAHLNHDSVQKSALEELLERDAILMHWFSQTGMTKVNPETYPKWLKSWIQKELSLARSFADLHVFKTKLGHIPAIATLLLDKSGHGVMSHASGENMEVALSKALAETCRIAQIALEALFVESSRNLSLGTSKSVSAIDHAMVYAYHREFPKWIFGEVEDWKVSGKNWKQCRLAFDSSKFDHTFHEVLKEPLSVGYCTSSVVQGLFFGNTPSAIEKGLLNLDRLNSVSAESEINLLPHFVA